MESKIVLTYDEYSKFSMEKQMIDTDRLRGVRMPGHHYPITAKIEAAGIDPLNPYNRILVDDIRHTVTIRTTDKSDFEPVAIYFENGEEPTQTDVYFKDQPPQEPLFINTMDHKIEQFTWNPEKYKVVSYSELEGRLILEKRKG